MKIKAFTILEIVMVLLIIGIIAAVVVNSLQVPSAIRLAAAKNKIMYDIRYTQSLAITHQGFYGIAFDTAYNNYYLYQGDFLSGAIIKINDPVTGYGYNIDFKTDPRFRDIVLSGVSFFKGFVQFDQWGVPYDGNGKLTSEGRIQITDSISHQAYTIAIAVNTGLVSTR